MPKGGEYLETSMFNLSLQIEDLLLTETLSRRWIPSTRHPNSNKLLKFHNRLHNNLHNSRNNTHHPSSSAADTA